MDLLEMTRKPLVYSLPGMEQVQVIKDGVYKQVGQEQLRYDLYRPADQNQAAPLPVVIFVHGDAAPEVLRDAKDWTCYRHWGQLTAVSGMAAITFSHRSSEGFSKLGNASSDVEDMIEYVRAHADTLGIDATRVCLWVCSAGGPAGLAPVLKQPKDYIRCVVALYPILDLQHIREQAIPAHVAAETVVEHSPLAHLRPGLPPTFLVRAGRDWPWLNSSIDAFLRKAIEANLEVEYYNHALGQHAFDLLDDYPRSRYIIERCLHFMRAHLVAK